MIRCREITLDVSDTTLSLTEWAGAGDPILLIHATGFHRHCWNEIVARLPGRHIYTVDLRFHGASGQNGEVRWELMANDIEEMLKKLDLNQLIGAGHSLGGHILTRVAAKAPERFKHIVLVDPVIMSPQRAVEALKATRGLKATDHPVSRRKNLWQDAEEMYQRFKDRTPFDTWQPQVLRDYCDHALRPPQKGAQRQLACDPINEAAIYLNHSGMEDIFEQLDKVLVPATLLRAPPGDGKQHKPLDSPTWSELASALPDCRDVYLPDHNHFIPMQDPELVAGHIGNIR